MYKLILLSITIGSFIFANMDDTTNSPVKKSTNKSNEWIDASDDNFKADAGRRRGKGPRGRRRGGSGLR